MIIEKYYYHRSPSNPLIRFLSILQRPRPLLYFLTCHVYVTKLIGGYYIHNSQESWHLTGWCPLNHHLDWAMELTARDQAKNLAHKLWDETNFDEIEGALHE